MRKHAFNIGVSPAGSAASLFNPVLSNKVLDMVGGVGEYTLPQRGGGMALGALVGSYLGGDDNRELGTVLGAGAGYGGAMLADEAVRGGRRQIVQSALDRAISNDTATIANAGETKGLLKALSDVDFIKKLKGNARQDMLDNAIDGLTTEAFATAGGENFGQIRYNYDFMHDLHNTPGGVKRYLKELNAAGISREVMQTMREGIENTVGKYKGGPSPDIVRYPFMSHELLERKSQLFNPGSYPGDYVGDFKGQAMDSYGKGITMGHNSMDVLGDEANLALRTMSPEETKVLRDIRRSSGELPALSAIRNNKDMYEVLLRDSEIQPWAKGTSTAIDRGMHSGKLLSAGEQALIDAGRMRNTSGSIGRAIREMEAGVMAPVKSSLGDLARHSRKYLAKLF